MVRGGGDGQKPEKEHNMQLRDDFARRLRGQSRESAQSSPFALPSPPARHSQIHTPASVAQQATPSLQSPRGLQGETSPVRSPLRSPTRRHLHDTRELLKYIDLDSHAYAAAVSSVPAEHAHAHALSLDINESAVRALREEGGPLHQLHKLKDEISDFNELFAKKKARADKIAAAGKKKIVHVDKVKLVQLDRQFYFEMHHQFDLYESFRLGRFCPNTPEKAQQILQDQKDLEAREAEELHKAMEAAALRIQAMYRTKMAHHNARKLKMQQMHAMRDTRSSRGSSRGSKRVPSRPSTAPNDDNMPQSPWDLFCAWCAGSDTKDAQKLQTMDYKEWVAMLSHLGVYPKRINKLKATEIFKQANRGAAGDFDTSELDFEEFEFAFRKLAESLGVHPNDVWCISKPSLRARSDEVQAPMSQEMTDLFILFAAGDSSKGVQSSKRAATMDAREFISLCEHLLLVPHGVSKTFAMESFSKAKQKGSSKDRSELDLQGFEWAMRRISRQVGADFATLHIIPDDAPTPKHLKAAPVATGASRATEGKTPRSGKSKWKAAGQVAIATNSLARPKR